MPPLLFSPGWLSPPLPGKPTELAHALWTLSPAWRLLALRRAVPLSRRPPTRSAGGAALARGVNSCLFLEERALHDAALPLTHHGP